jgi:GTP-binding protein HflX
MLEKVLNFEKTAIVGIVTQNQSEEKEYLDELEFLTLRWTSSQTFFAKNGTTKSQNICRNRKNRRNPSVCKENEISTH